MEAEGQRGPGWGAASEPWCVQGMEKSGPGERPPPCPFPVPSGTGWGDSVPTPAARKQEPLEICKQVRAGMAGAPPPEGAG